MNLNNDQDRLFFLVQLASLAPSSHNMQPWQFRCKEKTIEILPDRSRKLTVADTEGREFAITLGTVVGTLKMVSDCLGLSYQTSVASKVHDVIAKFEYGSLEAKNIDEVTLNAVINRHNSRLPFEETALPDSFLLKLKNMVEHGVSIHLVSDRSQKEQIKPVVLESIKEAFQDKNFRKELYPWLKPSIGRHEEGLVGKNLGMPFLVSLIFPSLTRFFDISNLQVKIHRRMLNNVPTFALLMTDYDTESDWLKVGMSFQKIAVEAEKNNISIGVMQGGIESPRHRKALQQIMATEKKLQMFFRLGFCNKVHFHSPRRPIKKIIIE